GDGLPYGGYYAATSYAGNHGTFSYYPGDIPGPPHPGNSGMFFSFGSGSVPAATKPNDSVEIRQVTDGLSHTVLLGEKYHYDKNFELLDPGSPPNYYPKEYPLWKWSAWAWMGGFKGLGHVTASSRVPINYKCPAACIGSTSFFYKDQVLNAFGSG